jgi:hypothetical protein
MRRVTFENQIAFSSLLLDTLFGLIIYFNVDSIIDITDPLNLFYYIFSMVVVIHWWFLVKSEEDIYGDETARTVTNTMVKTTIIVLLSLFVNITKTFSISQATLFLVGVYLVDILWCIVFRYFGEWITKDKIKIFLMENELDRNLRVDIVGFVSMIILYLTTLMQIQPEIFVLSFALIYIFNIILTYRYRIIDIPIF